MGSQRVKCEMINRITIMKKWKVGLWALAAVVSFSPRQAWSQSKKASHQPAFYSGVYRNVFREAGYSQAAIDEKVAKAYHDVFEGPNRVYFEVGDSMGFVSDVKNHDARTE